MTLKPWLKRRSRFNSMASLLWDAKIPNPFFGLPQINSGSIGTSKTVALNRFLFSDPLLGQISQNDIPPGTNRYAYRPVVPCGHDSSLRIRDTSTYPGPGSMSLDALGQKYTPPPDLQVTRQAEHLLAGRSRGRA